MELDSLKMKSDDLAKKLTDQVSENLIEVTQLTSKLAQRAIELATIDQDLDAVGAERIDLKYQKGGL